MDHFILSHEGTYTVSKYLKVHCHYPNHISALRKAGLTLSNLLTIGDLWSRHNEKVDMKKQPDVNKKKNRNVYLCAAYSRYFFTSIIRVINRVKKLFKFSCLRVRMSYHGFNNLDELLNVDLTAKIGRGIFSKYLMDRECNFSLPSKVNKFFVYEGKCRSKCLIYKVKCSMCDTIYIENTHQTFKKIMDRHFSNLLRLLKNRQKYDSFAAHIE